MLHSPGSPPALPAAPSPPPLLIPPRLPDCLTLAGRGSVLVSVYTLSIILQSLGSILFVCWLPCKLISLAQCFYLTLHPYTQLPIELTPGMSGSISNQRTKSKLMSFPFLHLPKSPHLSTWAPHSSSVWAPNLGFFLESSLTSICEHQWANPAGSPFKIHPESGHCRHLLCCVLVGAASITICSIIKILIYSLLFSPH